ncbi:MAG: hypothetical protein R3F34_18970 [Planctomycetota bacterium]
MIRHLLLLALALPLVAADAVALDGPATSPSAQDGNGAETPAPTDAAGPRPGELPADATPSAVATWRAMVAAIGAAEQTAPITSFDMSLSLLTRSGRRGLDPHPETHDVDTRVQYLAPPFVRYSLSADVETGYGPSGYWLKDKDEVRSLRGRDYQTDREQVMQVRSLCVNFLAVSDPSQLRIASLVEFPRCPIRGLPERPGFDFKRMKWLRIVTPDFQLVEELQPKVTDTNAGHQGAMYQVFFGLDEQTNLPRCAHVVRLPAKRTAPTDGSADGADASAPPPDPDMPFEQLILLDDWRASAGASQSKERLPHRLLVWERLPQHPLFANFLAEPDREVYVKDGSSLRPSFTPTDFEPIPPGADQVDR